MILPPEGVNKNTDMECATEMLVNLLMYCASSRPSFFNRSGLEQGDTVAETSSAPERWNGLPVLAVGMFSLCFARTAAAVLFYTIRRRSLQGFERGRESERLSRVQGEGA